MRFSVCVRGMCKSVIKHFSFSLHTEGISNFVLWLIATQKALPDFAVSLHKTSPSVFILL